MSRGVREEKSDRANRDGKRLQKGRERAICHKYPNEQKAAEKMKAMREEHGPKLGFFPRRRRLSELRLQPEDSHVKAPGTSKPELVDTTHNWEG